MFYVRELVCVVGSLGVFAFWYVDQSVYQRLLHSSFAYGLYLEQQNPDLPQMRSSLYWANLDITGRLGMFYRMQFWAFVVLAGLFLLFPPDPASIKLNLRFLVFGYAALGVFLLEMVTWDWASLDNTIRRLYPETLHRALPAGAATEAAWLARIRAIPIPANPENPAQAGQLGAEAAVAAADPLEGG